jgi:splicing factor 3B subunit 5
MTKHEWAVNHHRDSAASHIGHSDLLTYFAVAENESIGRMRYRMLEKMVSPCGPPPTRKSDDAC